MLQLWSRVDYHIQTLMQPTSLAAIYGALIKHAFGCYFGGQPPCPVTDTLSPQSWLFLGHLRAAEVAPKRGITERPVIYFKLVAPHRASRGETSDTWISCYFRSVSTWLRARPAPICRHSGATLVLLHGSMAHLPLHSIHWNIGGFGHLLLGF